MSEMEKLINARSVIRFSGRLLIITFIIILCLAFFNSYSFKSAAAQCEEQGGIPETDHSFMWTQWTVNCET